MSLVTELVEPFEQTIVYLVVTQGVTISEPDDARGIVAFSVFLSLLIRQLSALVLAQVRVDDCPEVIDAGEAKNDETTGVVVAFKSITTQSI